MLHKVLDRFESTHPDMEKTGDTLFPPDLTHELGNKIFKLTTEGGYRV